MARTRQFDVIVIGGGSGLTAAYYAEQDGKSIALVTDRPGALGGTCVNFGCIPTKTLIQSADVMNTVRAASTFGIHLDQSSVRADFPAIMRDMRAARAEAAERTRGWVEEGMTTYYAGVEFAGDNVLETESGERLTGRKCFIATGARASVPPIEGLADAGYWTNEDVLELETQPDSLIIIGGGYIGAEMGHFFSSLGTAVTLVNPRARLLAEDDEVGDLFTREFGRRVALVTGRAVRARRDGDALSLTVEDDRGETRTIRAQHILLAAGRRPNTDRLALAATGVECGDGGAIRVDEHLRTTHPDIYAYGDVIGRGMFKHTSSYEGELAYRNSQGGARTMSYRANPHAVFSNPQIGAVGMTERECREARLDYTVSRKDYASVARGRIDGSPPGFAKLIVEKPSDRILGFHMIGPDAANLVHEVVAAMNAGAGRASLVRETIHIHPTLAELVRAAFDSIN